MMTMFFNTLLQMKIAFPSTTEIALNDWFNRNRVAAGDRAKILPTKFTIKMKAG
jgi:hypothetical protein